MNSKYNKLYRVQASLKSSQLNPYLYPNYPIRRVIVNHQDSDGAITYNPNSFNYIYFSRSIEHHCYYIYNKVLKIIISQLDPRINPEVKKLNLPENFNKYQFLEFKSKKIIQEVQNFFKNYLPKQEVELVTLRYLYSLEELMRLCSVKQSNTQKINNTLEYSDIRIYKGSYGMNDAWLGLLECCTVDTKLGILDFDKFFNFLKDIPPIKQQGRNSLALIFKDNEILFDFLSQIIYTEYRNPQFSSKNNINEIIRHATAIKDYYAMQSEPKVDPDLITEYKKKIIDDVRELR